MKPFISTTILLLIILVSGCENDLGLGTEERHESLEILSNNGYYFHEGQTILGDKIEIPYSIENLRKAFSSIPIETRVGMSVEDIQPTHYYVRFSPKDVEQLDILINIPELMLSEVPLDREILVGGISYHDPELPLTQPTYQYTTLEVPYWRSLVDTLSVECEVLIEAYMPDYLTNTKSSDELILLPDAFYQTLIKEAYSITGTEYDFLPETRGSGWNPTGRIRAYDNVAGDYVPIQDVVIRGTHLLKIKETTTDSNGYFTLPSFNNAVTLKVVWEGDRWDVRDGNLGQAIYDGPKLTGGSWNLDISSSSTESCNISAVFRAARRVYNGYNYGLSKPANSRREKIAYIHNEIAGINGDYNRQAGAGIWSDIRIAGKNSSGWRLPSELFSTTCHELGHAAHYTNAKNNYKDSESRVRESWARFHQYLCTIKEYTDLGVVSNLWSYDWRGIMVPDAKYNFQYFDSSDDHYQTYTSLFIDIYDTYNQHNYSTSYINDIVSGFPVSSLEGVVYGRTTFAAIKEHFLGIVNTTGANFGMTNTSVDELFSIYNNF